jgi:hypothetical protein
MSKLVLNDDGSITLPLRGKEPLTLPEPSIAQLAEMVTAVYGADEAIPDVPTINTEDAAAVIAAQEVMRDRTLKMYASDSPYGEAVVKIVKIAVDADITLDDLPSWCAAPQTCRQILQHWQSPLAGED